jgi:undecaprenyl-diphosphatase
MDPSTLQPFFDWLAANTGWAALIVFFIALTESLIIVGLLVPGTMAMMGVGALIGAGVLPFWPMAIWAMLGAVIGDAISYWVGYHYRERLRTFWPFNKKPQLLDKGEAFFNKHGGKSVLFGRFVGPVRPIIPAVAGMMEMPKSTFFTVNILSAIAWAPVTLLPGVVLGASLSMAAAVAGRLAVFIVLVIALLWLAILISRRLFRYFSPRALQIIHHLLLWARAHAFFGPLLIAVLDPKYPSHKALALISMVMSCCVLLLVVTYSLVASVDPAVLDVSLQHFMQGLRTPLMDELMLLHPALLPLFVCTVLLLLLLQRQFSMTLYLSVAVALLSMVAALVNVFWLGSAAPHAAYAGLDVELMLAVVVAGMLAVSLSARLPLPLRPVPYVLAIVAVGYPALASLYFAEAWLSEVLLAIGLALLWTAVFAITSRRHLVPVKGVLLAVSGALIIGTLAAVWLADEDWQQQALTKYEIEEKVQTLSLSAWQDGRWQDLPLQRFDMGGVQRQPFVLQWRGEGDAITEVLQAAGWMMPKALDAQSWLHWFAPQQSVLDVPLLPRVHDGRYEEFKFVRAGADDALLVLRFWLSQYEVDGQPLWLVSLSRERLLSPLGLMFVPRTVNGDGEMPNLLSALPGVEWQSYGSSVAESRYLLWQKTDEKPGL